MYQEELLQQVVSRLDQVIALLKLANQGVIEQAWKEITKDEVSRRLIDSSDGTLESGELQNRVAQASKKSTRTVRDRISELVRLGALRPIRRGNKVYYQKSDIFM